uniref:DUF1893 domain-containing protein n=1 Tax=candidate division WOR-3 bacterium TaxID=2052148 RepID=A0A7C4GIW1_UNCW3
MSLNQPSDADLLARLAAEGVSLLLLQADATVFKSRAPGVRPLLELVDRFPEGTAGATAVDRLVGGCAARVFVLLRVGRVVADVMSEPGRRVLEQNNTPHSFRRLIAQVRNRDNTDVCPFEKLSEQHPDPVQLIQAIRRRLHPDA